MNLGNVLPNETTLRKADEHACKQENMARSIESRLEKQGYTARKCFGETRFYDGETRYCVVSRRNLKIKWFRVTSDGDFAE